MEYSSKRPSFEAAMKAIECILGHQQALPANGLERYWYVHEHDWGFGTDDKINVYTGRIITVY